MGFLDFLKNLDINQHLRAYHATPGAMLLDVRIPQEYQQGRIPGSKNVPLQAIHKVSELVKNKSTPLFVYCYSGARSRQAVSQLQQMGYTKVRNIGGISAYSGKVEV